jgi:hypothetical protein
MPDAKIAAPARTARRSPTAIRIDAERETDQAGAALALAANRIGVALETDRVGTAVALASISFHRFGSGR